MLSSQFEGVTDCWAPQPGRETDKFKVALHCCRLGMLAALQNMLGQVKTVVGRQPGATALVLSGATALVLSGATALGQIKAT